MFRCLFFSECVSSVGLLCPSGREVRTLLKYICMTPRVRQPDTEASPRLSHSLSLFLSLSLSLSLSPSLSFSFSSSTSLSSPFCSSPSTLPLLLLTPPPSFPPPMFSRRPAAPGAPLPSLHSNPLSYSLAAKNTRHTTRKRDLFCARPG